MQSYLSDMLARERITEFRRDADRDRLAALARATARLSRRAGGSRLALVARQPKRVAA
jgi:uncharacterized protein with von Willebrand factor type A (vWA) domain